MLQNKTFLLLMLILFGGALSANDTPSKTPPPEAVTTASGLSYLWLSGDSDGPRPGPTDRVSVHYTGWTQDGRMFDSSVQRGNPVTFPLNQVIKGWSEGLQLMSAGQKFRLWVPAKLAYGDNPRPGAPVGNLIFDVELLSIERPMPQPKVPEDVARIPDNAEIDDSGIASRLLTPGSGKVNPKQSSLVKVHYSGWTTDGILFDSSVVRNEPLVFPVNRVIRGWTLGLQKMTVGEKRRFWIPPELAYGRNPPNGAPTGMLVFDIELLQILNL